MAPVVIMLSTSLVAVPAFMRVEPVTTSGPVSGSTMMSARSRISAGGGEQATSAVLAPTPRAYASACRTYGVVPEAAIPMTKSPARTPARDRSSAAAVDAIFRSLLRSRERCRAAGDDPLHHFRIGAECGRTFRRVEHTEAAGRSRADIEQAAAVAKGRHGAFNDARDRLAFFANGRGNGLVFGVYEINDLQRRREIDVGGARVPALGEPGVDERHVTS